MTTSALAQSAGAAASDTLGGAQGDALLGLATLGKTALALALVVGVILACSALLKRLGPGRRSGNRHLKTVASTAVGQRERVVIVDVEGTWLVLGVGGGQVTALHQMPAPEEATRADDDTAAAMNAENFAGRFAAALRHNATQRFSGGRQRSGDDR